MYSLEEIVDRNNRAVRDGWIAPGGAVHSPDVKVDQWVLVGPGGVIESTGTKAQMVNLLAKSYDEESYTVEKA